MKEEETITPEEAIRTLDVLLANVQTDAYIKGYKEGYDSAIKDVEEMNKRK